MLQKLFTILVLISVVALSVVQATDRTPRYARITDGSEVYVSTSDFKLNMIAHNYPPVQGATLTYQFSPTGVFTVYDLQSNAVPNQIWQDPLVPGNVHACFMYSTVAGFATRDIAYIFSTDGGDTWSFLGNVPSTGRSGFPSISGFTNGAAVISDHTNTNGTSTHTKAFYDAGAGFGVFTEVDPGQASGTDAIWPKIVAKGDGGVGNSRLALVSSVNATAGACYTNSCTNITAPGTFSGWAPYDGDNAESYCVAVAPNGTIGHAYIGNDNVAFADVFYRFSTDDGASWSTPVTVWDYNANTDSLGDLRGVTMVYGNNNEPYVAINIMTLDPAGGFFPGLPSDIRVWSPSLNGGVPKIIADQSTVPFFPNQGHAEDAFTPLCRPSIGRSSTGNGLYVSYVATTGQYSPVDTSAYFAAWFSYSNDNGNSWAAPERMTPATPLRDWRFVSTSQVNNVSSGSCLVQMIVQNDSLAGTHVNGAEIGNGEATGIRVNVPMVGISNISSVVPSDFNLRQNYPNPFNPTTSIRFDLKKATNVTLKVYNANGQEVATLANNEYATPGTKEVTFNGSDLGSGIYFYTLFAGDFKETKKMMLIK